MLADPELLLGALTYHALAGTQTTAALVSADYETLNGASVTVVVTNVIRVNHAEVIQGDLLASNGVAHVIDTVLLLEPPQIVTQPETPVGAYVGNTISLSVVAIGADPVQYQWTKGGCESGRSDYGDVHENQRASGRLRPVCGQGDQPGWNGDQQQRRGDRDGADTVADPRSQHRS